MTSIIDDIMRREAQREFAHRQSCAPTQDVMGITFQRVVHGDTRREQWWARDFPSGMRVVDASHDHEGQHYISWSVRGSKHVPERVFATRTEAMAAALVAIRQELDEKATRLEEQARDARAMSDRLLEVLR